MNSMVNRNIKLFFRDRANVFFSMLSVLIIITLFALFLGGGNWGSDEIRDSWLMAGVLAVATVTTSLGAFSTMVEDRATKIGKGFYASPIKRSHITASYIISPFIVGVLMTTITAIGFGAYLIITGNEMLTFIRLLQLVGLILLSGISGTALMCFIVSLVKTVNAYSTITAIIGTLAGFLMGIYMPIGNLPTAVQYMIMLFPPAHAAKLFRQILMERPMELAYEASRVYELYEGQYALAEYLDLPRLKEVLGVVFRFGNFEITPIMSIIFLVVTTILFFGLSMVTLRKTGR